MKPPDRLPHCLPFEPAGETPQLHPRLRLQRKLASMRGSRARHAANLRRVAVQQAAVANFGQLALTGASLEFLFEQVSALVTNLLDVEACRIVASDTVVARPDDLAIGIASPDGERWGFLHLPNAAGRVVQTSSIDFLRSLCFILGHAIARQQSDAELRRMALQQSAIAELGKLMMTSIDDATIERACELVIRGLGADYSCFAELSSDGTTIHRRGGGALWAEHLPQTMPVSEQTHVGLTVLRGEPIVVDDYATETRFRTASTAVASGVASGVVVPVASATRTYGVLSAHAKTKRRFGPIEVDYLLSLANIIGDALAREEAHAALVATSRSLQLVLESTMDGIYTMDVEGRCTMINAAAARMLGRTSEEMLGANMHELMHAQGSGGVPFAEIDCPIYRVLRDRAPRTIVGDTFWRSDGTALPIDYSAAPIFDGDVAVGAVVAFTDTAERRKLELKLAQAMRLSSLGRLAATIAHEFNNVLMGISPFVELIRRRPERAATSLDQIGVALRRGKRITEEILRFTKPAELIQTAIAIEPWLESIRLEAQSLLPATHRVTVTVAEPLHVVADRDQLSQVVMNLILNARDAMEAGGTISIAAHREAPGAKFPFGLVDRPERFVHFTIRDCGCGMSPETLKHIFEPLFTTKNHGTGLGLAVAHQVVERHGGEIFVESGADGSTFHIFIPFAERAEESPAPPSCELRHGDGWRNTRVLLVDDDETVAAGLVALLEMEGFRVELAMTGAAALRQVERQRPDLVLLDVRLPDVDGGHVYEQIRALDATLPVIFSTGHMDSAPIDGLPTLFKPYDLATLLETIERTLPRRATPPPPRT